MQSLQENLRLITLAIDNMSTQQINDFESENLNLIHQFNIINQNLLEKLDIPQENDPKSHAISKMMFPYYYCFNLIYDSINSNDHFHN